MFNIMKTISIQINKIENDINLKVQEKPNVDYYCKYIIRQ